jgi:hypothetical protein
VGVSRRSKLISYLDRQLANVHNFKAGSQTRGAQFWLDQTGAIFLSINYGKYPLEVLNRPGFAGGSNS